MSEPTRPDDTWLVALGAVVSDGGAVDWDAAESRASDREQRRLVHELRRVASLIKAHASTSGDAPEPTQVPAGPSGHWRHLVLFENLGRGAFGAVYRAWDAQLDRDVAVKLIGRGAGRVDSPLAEARHLARIRHPHVVTVYGADEDAGQAGIWMEYIQGQTLADLVRERGPMSPRETVGIGLELCGALSAIHKAGLLHRDIKAENVMRETGGRIVLMDFSGAAGVPAEGEAPAAVLTGTPLYMAPELFTGATPRAATDVYSLGVLLFYLLTGTVPVEGATAADLAAAHERGERKRLRDLRAELPEALVQIVERATSAEGDRRFRSAGELEESLAYSLAGPGAVRTTDRSAAGVAGRWWHSPLWMAGAVMLAFVAGAAVLSRSSAVPPAPLVRFTIGPPLVTGSWPRLTPNGNAVVFGTDVNGRNRFWVQPLDEVQGHALLETTATETPFFSPDSRTVAFFENSKLKRISIDGGYPEVLADAPFPHGGDWNGRTILFSRAEGIYRIDADGGSPVPVTTLDQTQGDYQHNWPEFLPDGERFFYVVRSSAVERTGLYLGNLSTGSQRRLGPAYSRTAYAAGHIFYVRNGTLMAERFDPRTETLGNDPTVLGRQIQSHAVNDAAFDVSDSGRLIYFHRTGHQLTRLALVDRDGKELREIAGPAAHSRPRISPDGHSLAAERLDPGDTAPDLWIYSTDQPSAMRLTRNPSPDVNPVWSPGTRQIAFSSKRGSVYDVYVKTVNVNGDETLLPVPRPPQIAADDKLIEDWTTDGRFVLVSVLRKGLWMLPLDASGTPRQLLASQTAERWMATLSPDHRWLAYVSGEYGQREVYVEPFPTTGDRWQVSAQGGGEPHWRGDGGELYYLDPAGSVVAVTQTGGDWQHPRTTPLFKARIASPTEGYNFSPMPDGSAFAINQFVDDGRIAPVEVVLNWPRLLER